jgi:hypothetical protein
MNELEDFNVLLDNLQRCVHTYNRTERNDPLCVELGETIKLLQLEFPEGTQVGNCVKDLRSYIYHMCEMSKPGLTPEPPNHISQNNALECIDWLRKNVRPNERE